MKKFLPLHLAIFSIALFCGLVLQHEWHLRNSQSIYVELAPVDPRSILQGDYMALNYELHFEGDTEAKRVEESGSQNKKITALEKSIQDQAHLLSYVQLDDQRRVIQTSLDKKHLKTGPETSARLVLKNPSNRLQNLYPAANSFMFAEGLELCYRNAKYAEIKVKENGQALLADLVDQNLKSLNCESQKKWAQGS
ncbi:GDYXXLXY protein [Acinetobacter sp. LoGeW2-3]|uniref:GDYXXLXY domain-containing protein n=1 Tax=Acinetobacter sp. LoGeW2-3 TaxID=1808001 RepID=UPI000C05C29A|nr:GDYXXLXY domain-containing protein [Acinetobacter sp. LoGeW2-3]ATO19812.1 GDYXXLXY protein [Acinetobacter sp. LoGeW2-3]